MGRSGRGRKARIAVGLLIGVVLLCDVVALGLAGATSPLHPPVGAAGVGEGPLPVVLVAGVMSSGGGFADLTRALAGQGIPVLDFDAGRPGTQPFTFVPSAGDQHIDDVAATMLQPAIGAALGRAGYDPDRQHVDVVAHSVGGLLVRVLIEQPGGAVAADWGRRIDDLVMVATPNHGSTFGAWLAGMEHSSEWDSVADDFRPGSDLLRRLGTAEPVGEVYTAIGGEAWPLNWLRSDEDTDGHSHGHDGVVPAESPFLTGASLVVEPRSHGRLLSYARVTKRVVATLTAGG